MFTILAVFISMLFYCGQAAKKETKDVKKEVKAAFEIGKVYHGFKFIKEQKITEYDAVGKLFEHQKSGARLLKIEADDDNNSFNIAFKTPPLSDSGTPHILEHSVLNGSKNFPVKSPFDELSKASLKTFLNAMTGSDVTTYPVSSRNKKDYKNLMHVYLDAVFFPLMKEDSRIFKQEGWHYELDSIDGPLTYKGVVYNEMKGSFSSPERELGYVVDKNMFPDTCYGLSSGGYPTAIPKLTYENFKAFHDRYYHPSNSYIMVYGDYPVMDELEFINREYLSKFDKIKVDSEIKMQKPFEKMKEVVAEYPLSKSGKDKGKTYFNLSFMSGKGKNRKLSMAMNILSYALVNFTDSPVRRALQDAGIGKEYTCYNSNSKQMSFSITVEKANPEDKEKLKQIIFKTLEKVAKEGLDKKVVQGYINRMEFNLREPRAGLNGLIIGFNALTGWMYAEDPFLTISYKPQLIALRKAIDTGYFEKLIQEKILNNTHSVFTMLKPKKGLMEENIEKIKMELAEYKKTLSKEQLEQLVKETEELKEYQKQPNSKEALAKMPYLEIKDIAPRVNYFKISEKDFEGTKYLNYPVFSKEIVYVKALFNASTIPQKLIPYAALLTNVLGQLNSDNFSYGDLNKEINLHTGGINTSLRTYQKNRDMNDILPKVLLSGKVMNYKIKEFVKLCIELTNNSKFNDKKRLKEVLDRHQANLEAQMNYNGIGVAMTRLSSYYSISGKYSELTRGLSYTKFITALTRNFDKNSDDIIKKLEEVAKIIFTKSNLEVSVTAAEKDIKTFQNEMKGFVAALSDEKPEVQKYQFKFDNKNEGITSTSKVQYVLQGFNYKDLGYKYSGKMAVLTKILSTDYLHKKVRVMGGAYGGFCGINDDGMVYFGSYRDPNLKKTLEIYKKTTDYLKNFKVDKKSMSGYIIGTLSKFERPYTAKMKGNSALNNYYENISKANVQQVRKDILSTTPEDINGMMKMIEDILSKNYYCVFGNEKKIKESKDIFTKLIKAKD